MLSEAGKSMLRKIRSIRPRTAATSCTITAMREPGRMSSVRRAQPREALAQLCFEVRTQVVELGVETAAQIRLRRQIAALRERLDRAGRPDGDHRRAGDQGNEKQRGQ